MAFRVQLGSPSRERSAEDGFYRRRFRWHAAKLVFALREEVNKT